MLKKFRHSIVGKIVTGYFVIILVAFGTTLISIYSSWEDRKIDELVSETYYPMVLALKKTQMVASESYKLTNNWIYQPNSSDRAKLKAIHTTEANLRIEELSEIPLGATDSLAEKSNIIQITLKELLEEQTVVMNNLSHDTAYTNDQILNETILVMDRQVAPTYESLIGHLTEATDQLSNLIEEARAKKQSAAEMVNYWHIFTIALFVGIGVYATRFTITAIKRPIAELSDLIIMLSRGKFVPVNIKKGKDEIGRMAEAIDNMMTGLKGKVEFAENIGKGNYESNFQLLSEDDTMGGALIQMRNNLKQAADEDRKRNWVTEGLAKFADILRSRNDNLKELSENIISNLVKYMGVNQGALFLINDDNEQDVFIELAACYAYNRRKFLNKRIEIGEGLAGQCVLEKDTIYMSEVPGNYIKITSGLGEALPRNVLIVPLKLNDAIFGVVEIASFHTIERHQVEFVEKLGESIASTVSSVKINNRTKTLLEETQVQAEQMRAQEEEMRQNMEELSATQEEMHRAQRRSEEALQEMKEREKSLYAMKETFELRERAIALTTLVTETDLEGNITYANEKFCEVSGFAFDRAVGQPHKIVRHADMPAELFKQCWQTIGKGNVFSAVMKNRTKNGEPFWVDITITPVKNEHGDFVKFVSAGHLIQDADLAIIRYNRQAAKLNLPKLQEAVVTEP